MWWELTNVIRDIDQNICCQIQNIAHEVYKTCCKSEVSKQRGEINEVDKCDQLSNLLSKTALLHSHVCSSDSFWTERWEKLLRTPAAEVSAKLTVLDVDLHGERSSLFFYIAAEARSGLFRFRKSHASTDLHGLCPDPMTKRLVYKYWCQWAGKSAPHKNNHWMVTYVCKQYMSK